MNCGAIREAIRHTQNSRTFLRHGNQSRKLMIQSRREAGKWVSQMSPLLLRNSGCPVVMVV